MSSLLAVALDHHSAGRRVLPVQQNKSPACKAYKHWFQRPQSEEEVRELFSNGTHGISLMLYPATELIVLDFDGPHARDAWRKTGIELTETARSISRSGGEHLAYKTPAEKRLLDH